LEPSRLFEFFEIHNFKMDPDEEDAHLRGAEQPPPQDEPERKRSRRGKSLEKIAHDKTQQYCPVQLKLNTFLRKDFSKPIKILLEDAAVTMSQIANEAYQLLSLHVVRLLSANQELPEFDQVVFRSSCSLVGTGGRGTPGSQELRETADVYLSLRPLHGYVAPDLANLGGVIDSLSKTMLTMSKNHITLNAFNRIVMYAWSRYDLKGKPEAEYFVKSCFFPDWTDAHLVDAQREFKQWIEINPSFPESVEQNLNHFIKKLFDVLRYFEHQHRLELGLSAEAKAARFQHDRDRGWKRPHLRLFTMFPHKGDYVPSFFEVTKSALPRLLGRSPMHVQRTIAQAILAAPPVPNDPLPLTPDDRIFLQERMSAQSGVFGKPDFHNNPALAAKLWNTLFKCQMFDTRNRKFNYGFSTNGYAVSVNMQKPKEPGPAAEDEDADDKASMDKKEYDSPDNLRMADFDRFIGVDPGQTFVATAFRGVEFSVQDKLHSVYSHISTKEIRHDSKMNENKMWHAKFRKNNPAYANAIDARETLKTADYERLKSNIRTNFLVAAPITNLSKRKVFRARRFKSYRFGQKALDKDIKKLIGPNAVPSKTVIGWGHWEQQDGGFLRGNEKAPIKKLRRACREFGIKVIKIPEHFTSARCSGCRSANHKCTNVRYEGIKCHQVIRCTNSECEEVWQRDLNAARNISAMSSSVS
jgi:Putative transposase DNA-binding domain